MTDTCAFSTGRVCVALVEKQCTNCKFYKTITQLRCSREKSLARIQALPEQQRNHIENKYYYGRLV